MSKWLVAFFAALVLAGCVSSWNPLYTDADLTSDSALVGTFTDDDGKETWTFAEAGEKRYGLIHTDGDGLKAEFEVRLLKLKDRRFLDVYFRDASDVKLNGWASFSLVPTHLIFQVYEIGDSLKLSTIDPDWLKKHLEQNPKAIDHRELPEERLVLTASTKELQKFVLRHAEGEGLFGEPGALKRKAK